MQVRVSIRVSDGPGNYTDVSVQERLMIVHDDASVQRVIMLTAESMAHAAADNVAVYLADKAETSAA